MQTRSNPHRALAQSLSLLLLLLAVSGPEASAQSGGASEKKGGSAPLVPAPVPTASGKGLEGLKLPSDAIIVVCEQAADALRMLPRLVLMTPDEFKALRDELDRLRAKARPEKPAPPSFCYVEGKVEG